VPPHELRKRRLGVFLGIAPEQFGILNHGELPLVVAPVETEQRIFPPPVETARC
jgi:hypothetical protein